MIKRVFCVLLFIHLIAGAQTKKTRRVLFLGNSYTYVNNLPAMIAGIALANGDTLIYDGNLIGGYSLGNHFYDATSKAKINSAGWDYVVLQAQSQEPSFSPNQVNTQTLPYALKLDSLVKKNDSCTYTVFYETWGRKNGDTPNCGSYPPICTYSGMQDRLRASYKLFADTTKGIMCPVGEAFRRSISQSPSLELYDPDQSHPSLSGTYLAAYVFYELLFQRSTVTNTYNPGLPANTVTFLKQCAFDVLHDSLDVWNVGRNLPWAGFSTSSQGKNFQFKGISSNVTSTWYFGDGSTSTQTSVAHTYSTNGSFTVSHVVNDGCMKDSVGRSIFIFTPAGLHENADNRPAPFVYPNPNQGDIHFGNAADLGGEDVTVEIWNTVGQVVFRSGFAGSIQLPAIAPGLYFIELNAGKRRHHLHFIKAE